MLQRRKGACGPGRAALAAAAVCVGFGGGAALADEAVIGTMAAPARDDVAQDDTIWTRDTLTGGWGGFRTSLEDSGITLELGYTAETYGNVRGGVDVGFAYEGRVEGGLTLDLEKLLGWQGATIYASAFSIHHRNGLAVDYTGSLADPSNAEATLATRLFTLWIEQSLFDDKMSVRLGQLAADDEFITSDTAGNLLNGTFGWPVFVSANLPNGGAAYPLATPGARVALAPTDHVTVLAGVFAGDPAGKDCFDDPQICNDHGTTFSMTGGTLGIVELQYHVNDEEDANGLPATYKVGMWYQADGRFADQRTGANHDDDYGIYAVVDQAVYQGDAFGASVFARVGVAPNDRNLVSFYADGGFGLTGLIPERDDDVLTFGVAYMDIGGKAEQADIDAALPVVRDCELALELNYLVQLTPWWTLQPDLQYIVNPGGKVPHPVTNEEVDDAFIVGLRSGFTF